MEIEAKFTLEDTEAFERLFSKPGYQDFEIVGPYWFSPHYKMKGEIIRSNPITKPDGTVGYSFDVVTKEGTIEDLSNPSTTAKLLRFFWRFRFFRWVYQGLNPPPHPEGM